MVSRNYTVSSDRSITLNAKSPNNAPTNKVTQNNLNKIKQDIHYKQTSVGTQCNSQKETKSYLYSAPKKSEKTAVPTYTMVNKDLSSNVNLKSITPLPENYCFVPSNRDFSADKQRYIDPIYQPYAPNINTFSAQNADSYNMKTFKARPANVTSVPNHQSNSLPTIAENIIEEGEYPVDVGNLEYEYNAKRAKCLANAALKCNKVRECPQESCCKDHGLRTNRFECSPDRPHEITDSLKGHKPKYQGSHPDSLYRVPALGGVGGGPWTHGSRRLRSSWRFLRWPLALTTLCIALALIVYYLMPDINPPLLVSEKVNSTEWLQEEQSVRNNANSVNQPDLRNFSTEPPPVKSIDVDLKTSTPVPLFPINISPSVQYGNENQDDESNEKRTPKKPYIIHPATDSYDDKFLTQTFAIFYNKDAAESTTSESRESEETVKVKSQPAFTSGHQNSFGIPIEEASKLKTTTQSAIYNTKVSPTLPSMVDKGRIRSTTVRSKWNSTEDGICHSTRLSMCRGVLPYDLTTLPLVNGINNFEDLDAAVPYFDYFLRSGCSPRARQFVCSLLEPECKPKGMKILPPCRRACKVIAESCQDVIAANYELSQVFNCQQYPDQESECVTLARGAHCLTGEFRCPQDGSCVPSHWRCDQINDCPGGTDELNCDDQACGPSEFRCGDKTSCIPEEWVCDGHQDCPGAEDEATCGAAGDGDVISAASYHPRPARIPRPKLRTSTTTEQVPKTTMEYDNSKELLMMSDSVMPKNPPASLTGRKAPETTSTPRPYQVISSSSSVSSSQSWPCPKHDPNCRRKTILQTIGCIRGVNCAEDRKTKTTTTTTTQRNVKEESIDDVSLGTSHSSPCPQGELRCVDGRCITLSQLCDHHTDCSDGADEANCFA